MKKIQIQSDWSPALGACLCVIVTSRVARKARLGRETEIAAEIICHPTELPRAWPVHFRELRKCWQPRTFALYPLELARTFC